MKRYHLFAHNLENKVKVGDTIKAYDKVIGTIGNAGGVYYAHLHYSISEGLTPANLLSYVNGWTKDQVKNSFTEPKIDPKMFDKEVDVGNMGWGWLDNYGQGYHPGVDINGLGGGNTDLGYEFKSPVDGEVIYAQDAGIGWGRVIIIEEKPMSYEKNFKKIADVAAEVTGEDYGKNPNDKETERITNGLKNLKHQIDEPTVCNVEEIEKELAYCQAEKERLERLMKSIREIVTG